MAKEIERKYLVKSSGWRKCKILKKVSIRQGFISKSIQTVRVRVNGEDAFLTIKGPAKGLTRDEFEYTIPYKDGQQLLRMSITPIVSKTRYYVRDEDHQVWEVDVFGGPNRGLAVAEIELKNEKQSVKVPTWLGKEVSYDKRYTNAYIAEHKVPKR